MQIEVTRAMGLSRTAMKNSPEVIVNKTNQNFWFGLVVKVSILFSILVLMPDSVLACYGGGGGGVKDKIEDLESNTTDGPNPPIDLDDPLVVNLTGIKSPVERNIKTAMDGWEPSEKTRKEWKTWYENWKQENKKNKNAAPGSGNGSDPGGSGADDRGPGSGWPDLPGWTDLNAGNPGEPIPPWAYVPKNIGKSTICYLPPVKGTCNSEINRYGFNPYTNECQMYVWSGCGGTRNRFNTKKKCEEHCGRDPPPSCSGDSGIPDMNKNLFEKLNL